MQKITTQLLVALLSIASITTIQAIPDDIQQVIPDDLHYLVRSNTLLVYSNTQENAHDNSSLATHTPKRARVEIKAGQSTCASAALQRNPNNLLIKAVLEADRTMRQGDLNNLLIQAVLKGDEIGVDRWLSREADANCIQDEESVLYLAITKLRLGIAQRNIVCKLLKAGAKTHYREGKMSKSPLDAAKLIAFERSRMHDGFLAHELVRQLNNSNQMLTH